MILNKYSQHGEELVILDFFKDKPCGRFLDIGANDGISGSNTRALAELGWSGVLIEANPRMFVELVKNCKEFPKLDCVNLAVMNFEGIYPFTEMYDQCGTCKVIHQELPVLNKFYVAALTATEVFNRFGSDFDFISLDIEGSDLDVLNSNSDIFKEAKLICVEDMLPCADFEQSYYDRMLAAAARHGFTKVIHRTNNGNGNSLISR